MVGVATFISNMLFWQQTDYFNAAVELKPLIHTWSLSVEEQFYIVLPVLLIFVARFMRGQYRTPIVALTIVSFALSEAMLARHASADYYLLPSRAWELLAGSVVSLGIVPTIRRRSIASAVAAAGLASILASAMLLDEHSPFPGHNALFPCLGAAAFIHANAHGATPTGRLLGTKPFVFIGLISYSLYLVHWPLIVFVRYELLREPSATEMVVMFVAMVALAILSWRLVERPFRSRVRITTKTIFIGSAVGLVAMAMVGAGLFAAKGLPQRFPALPAPEKDPAQATGSRCFLKDGYEEWGGNACFITRGPGANILLWGDSHANHYRRALTNARPAIQQPILLYGSAGCLPIFDVDVKGRPDCRNNNEHVIDIIHQYQVKTVVLSGYWGYSFAKDGLHARNVLATVQRLRRLGVRVRIIGDNPDFTFSNPRFLVYRLRQRANVMTPFYMPIRNRPEVNRDLAKTVAATDFFDPMAILCNANGCLAYAAGQATMHDNAHFSPFGASLVVEHLRVFLGRR